MNTGTLSVSIIIPTKNSARTIESCLASCRAQTLPVEIVVVDNHSIDGTETIARRYADIFLTRGPERSAQRNAGVQAARGEYVAIIDSDMVLEPGVMESCLKEIAEPSVSGIVIPERSFGTGFWANCKALERSFYVGIPWMEAARFFRRADYLALGGYDESLVSGEDWDLSQRFAKQGRLGRSKAWINHDEGDLRLVNVLRKKFYYASKFAGYMSKSDHCTAFQEQSSVTGRYRLFLSNPFRLFSRPLIGCGMLFMKLCEFSAGAVGLAIGKMRAAPWPSHGRSL